MRKKKFRVERKKLTLKFYRKCRKKEKERKRIKVINAFTHFRIITFPGIKFAIHSFFIFFLFPDVGNGIMRKNDFYYDYI